MVKELIVNVRTNEKKIIERDLTQQEIDEREHSRIENEKQNKIVEINTRLTELSQDFIQRYLGAKFDDIDVRIEEFKTLHNELRVLQGKEPREY